MSIVDDKQMQEELIKELQQRFPDAVIEPCTIQRNNEEKQGITVKWEGEKIAPFFCYEDYRGIGSDLRVAIDYMEADIRRAKYDMPLLPNIFDPEMAKRNVYIALVASETNKAMLTYTVSSPFKDLAMVVRYRTGIDSSFNVTHALATRWHMTSSEVLDYALRNTRRRPYRMEPVYELLARNMGSVIEDIEDDLSRVPLYMVTNGYPQGGASSMCVPEVLEEVGKRLGESYYILPSSISEVLVMPKSKAPSEDYLREMVETVNREQIAPRERLSDSVYFYDVLEKKLTITGAESESEEQRELKELAMPVPKKGRTM